MHTALRSGLFALLAFSAQAQLPLTPTEADVVNRLFYRPARAHELDCRVEVFKPFLLPDDARNRGQGGTGRGLAIARDIARSHGGDITLSDSPMGGLRAAVRVPV